MTITLNGTTGITTPAVTNNGAYTGDGISFADGTPSNTLVTDTSGNVGIGTNSPAKPLDIRGSFKQQNLVDGNDAMNFYNSSGTLIAQFYGSGTSYYRLGTSASIPLLFDVNGTERARIDSSGNLLVGATSLYSGGEKLLVTNTAADWTAIFRSNTGNTSTTYGVLARFETTPNGTSNWFFRGQDSTTARCEFRSNGGLANFSANNVNLSDIRTKTNIELAGSYLNKICAIPVKTFLYKDQTDTELNLGVIAQDVEAVAPELVDVSGFGETPEDGVPLKTIYQTDLQYALMKCIQELKAELDTVKTELATLKGTA